MNSSQDSIQHHSVSLVKDERYKLADFSKLYQALAETEQKLRKTVKENLGTNYKPDNAVYLGHIIGADLLPAGFSIDGERTNRKLNHETGKVYKFNDPYGETRLAGENEISDEAVADYVRDIAKISLSHLHDALSQDEPVRDYLWQCNINFYSAGRKMSWHRDDRTDGDNIPKTDTFYPASATYIVSEANSQVGLCVLAPTKHYMSSNTGGLFFKGSAVRSGHAGPPLSALDYTKGPVNDTAEQDTLIILTKSAYTHGLHTNNINGQARRISFNFRFVREELWYDIHEGSLDNSLLFAA